MLASSRPLGTGSIDPLDPSHPDYSSNTAPEVAPFEFYPDPSSKTVYTAPFVTPDTRHEGLIPVTDFDGGEYAAPVVEAKKGKTILGLKKRTFIIVAVVLAVLVIIGVVIGVVMGLQNKASVEDGGLVGSSQAGGSKDSTATGTATASARISAQPRPTVAAKALGTNATFMEGSFFSGTSSADDKVRSSEAWTFYQDVDKNIRTLYCAGLVQCTLATGKQSYQFTGAESKTPIAAVGNLETTGGKIHLFYMDTNWNLQGKIFEKDGVISAHVIDVPYPAVHTRSQLTAVYYGNDVNLWFQQENGDIHTLHYTDGLWYAEDEAVVTDAKTGSSLSAVTWDSGDGSRAKKDQLIRLFYIITDGSFAQIQHSDAHGWSTNSPSTKASSVPTLSLQLNNPLAAFLGVSTGLVDPEIWIVTTATISDSVYKAVLFGSPAASGFKSVDNKSTQMYTEVFKTSFLRSPGDPLSVALLAGDINNDQSTWMWFGIGLNNRLYNTWWDGSKFDAAQVKIYETIPDA